MNYIQWDGSLWHTERSEPGVLARVVAATYCGLRREAAGLRQRSDRPAAGQHCLKCREAELKANPPR